MNSAKSPLMILKSYRYPLALACGMRLGLSLWVAGLWMLVDRYQPVTEGWVRDAYGRLPLHASIIERAFLEAWVRWDAVHYMNIAYFGYAGVGPGDMNFFPLYSYLTLLISRFLNLDVVWTGLLLSTLAFVGAMLGLYQLACELFPTDETLARWAVTAMAVYPASFFLSAPFSDGLYLALVIWSLWALRQEKWLIAGGLAALAGLTRGQGILLVFPYLVEMIRQFAHLRGKSLVHSLVGLAWIPAGWLGYVGWRNQRAGNLIDSFANYSSVHFADPFSTFIRALFQAFTSGEPRPYLEVLSLLFFGAILLWMLTQRQYRQETALMVYAFATLAIFMGKHSVTSSMYQSAIRYVLGLFPAFLGIASLLLKLPARGRSVWILLNLIGQMVATTLFVLWIFVG